MWFDWSASVSFFFGAADQCLEGASKGSLIRAHSENSQDSWRNMFCLMLTGFQAVTEIYIEELRTNRCRRDSVYKEV